MIDCRADASLIRASRTAASAAVIVGCGTTLVSIWLRFAYIELRGPVLVVRLGLPNRRGVDQRQELTFLHGSPRCLKTLNTAPRRDSRHAPPVPDRG